MRFLPLGTKYYRTLPMIVLAAALSITTPLAMPVQATNNGLGAVPLMGWSSWSLESTAFPGYGIPFLTAQNLMKQSDYLHEKLQSAGYTYFNIDSGWWMDTSWKGGRIQGDQYDAYGRPLADPVRFPDGMKPVIDHVKANGQHPGIYYVVGLPRLVYNANSPIFGTSCHARDIATHPLKLSNGWQDHWAIDFRKPCAQAYINSIANQFADWGVDFLKLDGVMLDTQADVKAWSVALQQTGRPIWLTLSWSLDRNLINFWKEYANAARISGDVECYCGSLVSWSHDIASRFVDAPDWAWEADTGYKNDLDSLDIGVGVMDGLSNSERQSYMTLWAISGANLLIGDDLNVLDSYGTALLTNQEVIAQDQTGRAARPASQTSQQQVWWVPNADGTYTVALFNLNDTQSFTVTANWVSFGLSGTAAVHDMWSHADLGNFSDSWSALLPPHGSRLIKVTPDKASTLSVFYEAEAASGTGTAVDRPCAACSGGRKLIGIGDRTGSVTFTVIAGKAGQYNIAVRYLNGDAFAHTIYVSANAGSDAALVFDATGGWDSPGTLVTTVMLNAGINMLRFDNPNAHTATIDLDAIIVPSQPAD